jgi:hypothetical protein
VEEGENVKIRKVAFRLSSILKITIAAGVVGAALLATPQMPAVAASGPSQSGAAVPAPVPAGEYASSSEALPASSCSPQAVGDYVHVSSTPPATASGHGWWNKGNCTAVKAQVTVQLQEYYSDGSWRDKGSPGVGDVYAGGGSSNRVTGRVTCSSTTTTGWRSQVTADVIGQSGLSQIYTAGQDIKCRV